MPEKIVSLDTELKNVKSISASQLEKLKKLGIKTVRDLLRHFPTRYEDFSHTRKIGDLKEGERATIKGEVKRVISRRSFRKNITVTEVIVTDETSGIPLVWFNQPYIAKTLKEGTVANFAGKVFRSPKGNLSISNPSFEFAGAGNTHTAGLIAVYPETRGLRSKTLRQIIDLFFSAIKLPEDFLPEKIRKKMLLPELKIALKWIHRPRLLEQAERAQKRFSFEYLFLIQLNNLLARAKLARQKAPKIELTKKELDTMLKKLPFTLTKAQKTTLDEICADLRSSKPMNRLLQGDVGSGKTVVVALAGIAATANDYQAVFMAPTEVLAGQHFKTFRELFPHLSCGILLYTASEAKLFQGKKTLKKISKAQARALIEEGKVKIVIGTHSLIAGGSKTKPLHFPKLGLIVIDEQHRFGVEQRAALLEGRKDLIPHFLSMSATPIPRTLTLTVFGDLDLSTINELPKGRKKIITKIVDPKNRDRAYAFIRQNIHAGRQAFFIFPRIEKSSNENSENLWQSAKTVTEEFEMLSKKIFPRYRLGMLHGRMKAQEKGEVMKRFKDGEIDILVSTSVVEVGVDVANASIMVIEGAEYFGLSQLYQFRGRVGRGQHQSFCFLFTESHSDKTHERLEALVKAKNGFELAEKDLAIRGPGQFFGTKQTGLPDMAMNALSDIQLVKRAQDAAKQIVKEDPELIQYPLLKKKLVVSTKKIHLE
ncbi:MAG: ATP-dependent DNA helicase RecG [Candidatus Harrisonbacteria bacterium]|nr:ATP-dependent DNA helicase RecG [Candidatus Harrisonbacteria bacterium]